MQNVLDNGPLLREKDDMTKTTTETTMTEVDKVFQVAARRIQELTTKVNYWKERAAKLESELGVEKAARIEAEATLSRTLNSWVGQIAKPDRGNELEAQTENKRLRVEVANLETQRDGLTTQVQDMRNEIARLRADLRSMSERSNGSEWEKRTAELEELRAELNSLKQERDCAKSEWDRAEERCKELTEDIEVIRIELRESQKEAVTARQDAVTRAEADRVRNTELFSDRQRLKAELAVIKDERNKLRAKLEASESESRGYYEELSQIRRNTVPGETNTQTQRSHPVRVGEWVEFAGKKSKVVSVGAAGYSLDGQRYCLFSDCTPCDPPEATEQMMLRREREFAVKEAKANAAEESAHDTPAQEGDIKAGDYVEVFQATDANWTLEDEIGIKGTVQRIEMTAHSIPIVLLSNDGAYALRDVRKIQREPKPGDKVRLVRVPELDPVLQKYVDFPWLTTWGDVGDLGEVIETLQPQTVAACVRISSGLVIWWPMSCIEIVDAK